MSRPHLLVLEVEEEVAALLAVAVAPRVAVVTAEEALLGVAAAVVADVNTAPVMATYSRMRPL